MSAPEQKTHQQGATRPDGLTAAVLSVAQPLPIGDEVMRGAVDHRAFNPQLQPQVVHSPGRPRQREGGEPR